jgi:hypothetical protein
LKKATIEPVRYAGKKQQELLITMALIATMYGIKDRKGMARTSRPADLAGRLVAVLIF